MHQLNQDISNTNITNKEIQNKTKISIIMGDQAHKLKPFYAHSVFLKHESALEITLKINPLFGLTGKLIPGKVEHYKDLGKEFIQKEYDILFQKLISALDELEIETRKVLN